ncbi:MAG: hypothetical protein ACN4GF_05100 [Lentimonas sp.]
MNNKSFNHCLIKKGQNDVLGRVASDPWDGLPESENEAQAELHSLRIRLGDLQ